ncbi:phosphopantetheine-binding protein [Achromobacter aloeverae]|nr:acyl carrier protein [Achromobacter aloeverae]
MMISIEPADIKEIVEFALDREIGAFSMSADLYDDYDLDSLGSVALVVEVEKRYDLRIPDERMPDVRTGELLKTEIERLLAERASGEARQ